jgi:hypothetical protein
MAEEIYQEARLNVIKFNEVGDYVKGTLISVMAQTTPDIYGKLSTMYTVKVKDGSFLGSAKNPKTGKIDLDKEKTILEEGSEWTFFANGIVVQKMKSVKLGQKFMIKFSELKPTTKGNDAKIKVVYPAVDGHGKPVMDEEWVKEQGGDTTFGSFDTV